MIEAQEAFCCREFGSHDRVVLCFPENRKESQIMPRQTTYAKAQANLADLCDQVTADRDVVVISRRGADDVALVAASELSGLLETAHLLRSPKNARRLMTAMKRAQSRRGDVGSVSRLRQEIGIDRQE